MMREAMSDELPLSEEWVEATAAAARNLGLDAAASELSPEHWQRVLANVEARMRMRGFNAPAGWREDLGEQVGREGEGYGEPES